MSTQREKIEQLIQDDAQIGNILFELFTEHDSPFIWGEVSGGDATSGHWGRLLDAGILVPADDEGVRITDEELVREVLDMKPVEKSISGDSSSGDSELDIDVTSVSGSAWGRNDKIAGLISLTFLIAYISQPMRVVIASFLNTIFMPLTSAFSMHIVILIMAVSTSAITLVLQRHLTDPDSLGRYRQRLEDFQRHQEELDESLSDDEMMSFRQDMVDTLSGMMKVQFRPTVYLMMVNVPVFLWFYWAIRDGFLPVRDVVLPLIGQIGLSEPVLGILEIWIVWYMICSFTSSQFLRKITGFNMVSADEYEREKYELPDPHSSNENEADSES